MIDKLFLLAQTIPVAATQSVASQAAQPATLAGWETTLVGMYRTAQVPLMAASFTILFGCMAGFNFAWKLKDEVYMSPAYLELVAKLKDVDDAASPTLGFEQFRRVLIYTMISAVASGAGQLTVGYAYRGWSVIACASLFIITLGFLAKAIHLYAVTSRYGTKLAEAEAAKEVARIRQSRPAYSAAAH